MEARAREAAARGERPRRIQRWVPLQAISPHLQRAVIVAEDAAFYGHRGIDLDEMWESVKRDWREGRLARGGSTITMQLAKNLYLSPSKNPLRKLAEVILALRLERTLSKSRILELYLNVIEWGEGIYGAEGAAGHYFGRSARDLTIGEAAVLAAMIPDPRHPGRKALERRRRIILERLRAAGHIAEPEEELGRLTPLPRR